MSTLSRFLGFVRSLLRQARASQPEEAEEWNPYTQGYVDALEEVEEWVLDEEWDQGEDEEEEE
jgi:hypothetical protein